MKKKLVFHFYCDENYDNNRAVKIHLQCLKYYHNIFDEALFCVALNNIENEELIYKVEQDILDCGFKNIIFKVVKNTDFREAETFYNEVINNNKTDEIVFFGHSKGYTNYNSNNSKDSLDTWICGLYYLSLEDMGFVKYELFNNNTSCFYGSFLAQVFNYNKYEIAYLGTFFWLNKNIFLKHFKNNIPLKCDKYSSENFPGELNNCFCRLGLSSYNYTLLDIIELYHDCEDAIKFILGDEITDFNKFKENIINKI